MYLPKMFEENRPEILHAFIRENPLGTLIVMTANGLEANHIPFEIDPHPAPFGTLHGHVSRANPVWREFSPHVDALATFMGPDSYITPSWYATKQETGKVVPTWDYIVVHARGPLRFVDDSHRLREHLERLTARHEAGRPHPWQISDAPADYIGKQLERIIAFEIPLTRLSGKWKLSQNRSTQDRNGIAEGLLQEDEPAAAVMAAAVRQSLDRGST